MKTIERNRQRSKFLFVRPGAIVSLFFVAYLILGLLIYRDYGVYWDEGIDRETGAISALYINGKLNHLFLSPEAVEAKIRQTKSDDDIFGIRDVDRPNYSAESLLTYRDRDYGVLFQLFLVGIEAFLKLEDSRDVYLMRHLCTFLLFYISVIFFYLVLKKRFHNWLVALLGCSLMIFSPRIFAESFYNSKDLAFLSLFIITSYSLIRFLENLSVLNALFHAAATAAAINIRVAGVVLPTITILIVAIDFFKSASPIAKLKTIWPHLMIYLCLTPVLTVLFWPYLWEEPISHFIEALSNMSRFRWGEEVLFLGNYVKATNLPWYYAPVWIAITTPPFYLVCFVAGTFYCVGRMLWKNHVRFYRNDTERQELIHLLLVFVPLISVIGMKSVLYNGWRHLYFIYPSFLIIAMTGLISFHSLTKRLPALHWSFMGALLISFTSTGYFALSEHPHQHVYFNFLAGSNVKNRFELDYWGLGYRAALEYVLKHDASQLVNVNVANLPGQLNARILPPQDRRRLRYVPVEDARYFLSNLRGRSKDSVGQAHYVIKVNDDPIMIVYKLR